MSRLYKLLFSNCLTSKVSSRLCCAVAVRFITEDSRVTDTWTLEDLATELKMTDTASVKNSLFFWNNQGVVKNIEGDMWRLLEDKDMSVDTAAAHGAFPILHLIDAN